MHSPDDGQTGIQRRFKGAQVWQAVKINDVRSEFIDKIPHCFGWIGSQRLVAAGKNLDPRGSTLTGVRGVEKSDGVTTASQRFRFQQYIRFRAPQCAAKLVNEENVHKPDGAKISLG